MANKGNMTSIMEMKQWSLSTGGLQAGSPTNTPLVISDGNGFTLNGEDPGSHARSDEPESERSAPMDYQERYLDMLQKSVQDIKDDVHALVRRMDRMESTIVERVDRMEEKAAGERHAMWALAGTVMVLVVTSVWGILQYSAALLQLIPHK